MTGCTCARSGLRAYSGCSPTHPGGRGTWPPLGARGGDRETWLQRLKDPRTLVGSGEAPSPARHWLGTCPQVPAWARSPQSWWG